MTKTTTIAFTTNDGEGGYVEIPEADPVEAVRWFRLRFGYSTRIAYLVNV